MNDNIREIKINNDSERYNQLLEVFPELSTHKEAQRYFDLVGWCIVVSKESFNDCIRGGSRFFFCENDDWFETPCQTGENYPLDNYVLSLLAVEIGLGNRVRSITTRWNDTGDILQEGRLHELLGENFDKLGVVTIL